MVVWARGQGSQHGAFLSICQAYHPSSHSLDYQGCLSPDSGPLLDAEGPETKHSVGRKEDVHSWSLEMDPAHPALLSL